MQKHFKLLSILHIVGAMFSLTFLAIGYMFYESLMPFIMEDIQQDTDAEIFFGTIFPFIRGFILTLVLVVCLPSLIGGIALLNGKRWGLTMLLVVGCLGLFNFPAGTALGVYTIWVFMKDQKELNG